MERSLVVSDVDGTLLGDDSGTRRFSEYIALRRSSIRLVYASGRFFDSLVQSIHQHDLPVPDAIICGVGTEIRDYPTGDIDSDWQQRVMQSFSADDVRNTLQSIPGLKEQPPSCQSSAKVSYFLHHASESDLEALRKCLLSHDILANIIYSSDRDLDVLPEGINKGSAVLHIARKWKISQDKIVVCGDSGNDLPMFQLGLRGIIVENAQPELVNYQQPGVFHATKSYADGVVEGLTHWLMEVEI